MSKQKRAQDDADRPFLDDYRKRYPRCQCGCGRRANSIHELLGGALRKIARQHRSCILNLAWEPCHQIIQYWPKAKQLALKAMADPQGFSLLEFNEIRKTNPVSMAEVDEYLTPFVTEDAEMAKAKVGSWVVELKCGVKKQIVVSGCTEQQATEDPYSYDCGEEIEIEQYDWEVTSVVPND